MSPGYYGPCAPGCLVGRGHDGACETEEAHPGPRPSRVAAMTVGELRSHLASQPDNMPVALLLDTDGDGIDLARPAGVIVTLGDRRRSFFGGMRVGGDVVLVLVASGSVQHALLRSR